MDDKERVAWQQYGMRRRPIAIIGRRAVWVWLALVGAYWLWHIMRFVYSGAELP